MRGQVLTVGLPRPAAGVDFTFTPSNGDRVRLQSLVATFTSSATVANRLPTLTIQTKSGLAYFRTTPPVVQAASFAIQYTWAIGATLSFRTTLGANDAPTQALPDVILEPGDQVLSSTTNIQAGDQWSNIAFRGIVSDHWEMEERIAAIESYLTRDRNGSGAPSWR